jgi:hypothetical protein
MTLSACSREKEIAALLARGGWPEACAPELRDHVNACNSCGDLVLVTKAFQKARADAASAAPVISPGTLWWRAQLRRRNAAVQRVSRPLLGAQIFALSTCLLVAIAYVVSLVRSGFSWTNWLGELPQPRSLHLEILWPAAFFDSGLSLLALIPVLATLALLGGVAVYLASEKR